MKKNEDPGSLREVFEWKEKAYKEVKEYDLKNALRKRLKDSIQTANRFKRKKQYEAA